MSVHHWGAESDRVAGHEIFQNIATGNAHVGVQAGKVDGNLSVDTGVSAGPGDIAGDLDRLRAALRLARQRGEIDAATLADSEHELGVTRDALSAPDPDAPGRAIRALRKLKGLVGEIAGFGAPVAAIMSTVERLAS